MGYSYRGPRSKKSSTSKKAGRATKREKRTGRAFKRGGFRA